MGSTLTGWNNELFHVHMGYVRGLLLTGPVDQEAAGAAVLDVRVVRRATVVFVLTAVIDEEAEVAAAVGLRVI